MKDHRDEIAKLEQQLVMLKKEQAAYDAMQPDEQMAVMLHDKLCHSNHIDGCGWLYEMKYGEHLWGCDVHTKYLRKAQAVMSVLDRLPSDAIECMKQIFKALDTQ